MQILRVTLFLAVLVCSFSAAAQESYYMHQERLSARVMGMGGAYTAVADDYLSLFFNVAGLARLEKGQVVADISIGATPTIINFYNDLSAAGSNSTSIQNTLANYMGSHFASRIGLGGTWVRPGWGISVQPLDLSLELDITGTAGASVGVEAIQDTSIQFGKAWNIGDDKNMQVGISPKAVYRASVIQSISLFQLVNSTQFFTPQNANEALMFDFDLGFLYTFKVPDDGWFKWMQYAKPSVGVAVRNVLDYGSPTDLHVFGATTSAFPLDLGRRIDVGTKFELPEFWVFKPRAMIDFHDLGAPQASFIKCSHFGTELAWKAFGWLNGGYRLGFSEGYFTAGISAELGIFLLDLATYSEEIGTSGSTLQSRRYMAQMSLDF